MPLVVEGQPAGRMSRVGVLPQLGYLEGQNLVIDWRYQLGGDDRRRALATELVRLQPDVIVADAAGAVRGAMQATSLIPIVRASGADAVGSGLVTNLGRPGRNITVCAPSGSSS